MARKRGKKLRQRYKTQWKNKGELTDTKLSNISI